MKTNTNGASDSAPREKSPVALKVQKILAFWQEKKIFELTNEGSIDAPEFTFYDGPPFATGTPHFGHLLPTSLKDAIPRYQVMKGNKVRRVWGWDCHGLPLENLIEKELGLKTKKDIEDLGIGKFNAAARASVLRYENEWKKIIPRVGRFVDMEHPYKTMDSSYTETIWWMFKELSKKDLVYKGYKSMHLCPRCETTLSNFEVNQGYKDITDISVYVKFALKDEPNTFVLAWTTTPWTLPGNVALAVHPTMLYLKVKVGDMFLILAKDRLSVLKDTPYEIVEEMHGTKLVGKSYEPLFDYYKKIEKHENAWKIYAAEFVTATDGTGIVHIAPGFGTDDLNVGRAHDLPVIQHVGTDGRMKKEVIDFAGLLVKPKGEAGEKDPHQKTDVEVIKYLAGKGLLFAKEKIVHSYPHCWRCETPLLNYATTSWFVKVSAIKDKMLEENKKVTWVPESIGQYRFGNWIEGSPDWAISRSRYWGAPLPVWMSDDETQMEVMGSVEDLKTKTRGDNPNRFFVMRHGEAENNVKGIVSSHENNPHHLTENGKVQAGEAAKMLLKEKIDVIIASPFIRTKETAEIVAKTIGFDPSQIVFDHRIEEIHAHAFDGKPIGEYHDALHMHAHGFWDVPEGCESYADLKKRMGAFLYDVNAKYQGKTILVVTHDSPLWLLLAASNGWDEHKTVHERDNRMHFIGNAEVRALDFVPLPHNENYELDFHRPFIDEIEYVSNGKKMRRVPEVFDCWFESGSMPYGQHHYMGKPLPQFDPEKGIGFPADFIAEGLDQTRGWFYSLLVLGVALFGKSPYKSVIVNGLILAEDGQKMSKSKKNYPELLPFINQFGVDAIRYYFLASPSVHADDYRFSEKGVDEVVKKHINRLENVYSFYAMYADKSAGKSERPQSNNVLDQWILARLDEVALNMTASFDAYEIDKATVQIGAFIDDLSTWYLRRSRDRFKSDDVGDKQAALNTTYFVLLTFSKLIAPIMPFLAEDLYQRLAVSGAKESVHLENWPKVTLDETAKAVLEGMKETRRLVTLALELRAKANIKVRQPLESLTLKNPLGREFSDVLRDEVNVKSVVIDKNASDEMYLETKLTPELVMEGQFRDLVRAIQDARKTAGLTVSDRVTISLTVNADWKKVVETFRTEIMQLCGTKEIKLLDGEVKEIPEIRLEK